MANPLRVTSLRVIAANDVDCDRGVIAWLSFVVGDGLLVDGVAFRITEEGHPIFAWPGRKDGVGVRRYWVRPLRDDAKQEIEAQLLRQIGPHLRGEGERRDRA
jgi:hypothetical protein